MAEAQYTETLILRMTPEMKRRVMNKLPNPSEWVRNLIDRSLGNGNYEKEENKLLDSFSERLDDLERLKEQEVIFNNILNGNESMVIGMCNREYRMNVLPFQIRDKAKITFDGIKSDREKLGNKIQQINKIVNSK